MLICVLALKTDITRVHKRIHPLILCRYGEFVLLYSCVHTLSEWYRSHNCDIGGTTTIL